MAKVLILSLLLATAVFAPAQHASKIVLLSATAPDSALPLPDSPDPAMSTPAFVKVVKVVNPKLVALSLDFALSAQPVGMGPSYPPTPVSTVGFYPADRAGSYSVSLAAALRTIRQRQPQATRFLLHASLRPTTQTDDIADVHVTLAPPVWSKEK